MICKSTYLTVRDLSSDARHIRAGAFAYNSRVAAYYLALVGSRIGHYITEAKSSELITVPLPDENLDLSVVTSFEEIDLLTREVYSLTEADWAIIEDLLEVRLPDALQKTGPGRNPTTRRTDLERDEPEMSAYGDTLTRVLKSTFGREKAVAVTIYQEPETILMPVRMITVHLNWASRSPLTIETIETDDLLDKLASFNRDVLGKRVRSANDSGLGFQRVAFFFHSHLVRQERIRNLTIIKPDEYRYWTRSQAMRDADELASSILQAAARSST